MKKFLLMIAAMVAVVSCSDAESDGSDSIDGGLWSDYADSYFTADGSGTTEADPYQITTAEQLAALANEINSGATNYEGSYFQLQNDIDLSDHEWVAIGTTDAKFMGVFDGNNFTVTGLYIINANTSCQGLFGAVYTATIKNLSVSGSVSCCGDYIEHVAGVVGYISASTITNCSNACSVKCVGNAELYGHNVGGVIGRSEFNSPSTITNCYNTGSVSCSNYYYVGGVTGRISSGDYITNCFNTGSVSGTGYVGGVLGYCQQASGYVTNCYNTGSVSCDYMCGGIVGAGSTITNSYNTGTISSVGENYGGVIGGNAYSEYRNAIDCYYLETSCDRGSASTASSSTSMTKADMQGADFVKTLNNYAAGISSTYTNICAWKEVAGDYPTLDFDAVPVAD